MKSRKKAGERKPLLESEALPGQAGPLGSGPRVVSRKKLRAVLVLRARPLPAGHPLHRRIAPGLMPHERRRLSRAELETLQAAPAADVAAVQAFARRAGLRVVESSRIRHDVVLEGTAADFERAFHVELEHFETRRGTRRGHRGPAHLEAHLHHAVESVLGLDELPCSRRALPGSAVPKGELFWPRQVAQAYGFPRGLGRGQKIALLAFGGGFHRADLEAYFARTVGHMPRVQAASVMGARNAPLAMGKLSRFVTDFQARVDSATLAERYGDDLEAALDTFETTMDVEIAGALAPEAQLEVWFAPDTPAGWYAAIHAALGEGGSLASRRKRRRGQPPTVLSISWGNAESQWNANRMWAIHRALELARHHGTTVCAASGDFGSLGLPPGEAPLPGVSFPASSPLALACGGTRLLLKRGQRASETAWNAEWGGTRMATGGGLSGLFPLPDWQRRAKVPDPRRLKKQVWISRQVRRPSRFRGRGVPDVAANADGDTGYRIRVGGVDTVGGGTSASTPLWAALVALLAEELGHPLGYLNPLVYGAGLERGFRDVTRGNNDVAPRRLGFFRAGPGWDAVCGLGAPDAQGLLQALRRPR